MYFQKRCIGQKAILVINKVDKENCRRMKCTNRFSIWCFTWRPLKTSSISQLFTCCQARWMVPIAHPAEDLLICWIPLSPYFAPEIREERYKCRLLFGLLVVYRPYSHCRITRRIEFGQNVCLVKRDGRAVKSKVKELYVLMVWASKGEQVNCGDICAVVGVEGFEIGDTIADFEKPEGLPLFTLMSLPWAWCLQPIHRRFS